MFSLLEYMNYRTTDDVFSNDVTSGIEEETMAKIGVANSHNICNSASKVKVKAKTFSTFIAKTHAHFLRKSPYWTFLQVFLINHGGASFFWLLVDDECR